MLTDTFGDHQAAGFLSQNIIAKTYLGQTFFILFEPHIEGNKYKLKWHKDWLMYAAAWIKLLGYFET